MLAAGLGWGLGLHRGDPQENPATQVKATVISKEAIDAWSGLQLALTQSYEHEYPLCRPGRDGASKG